MRVPGRDAAHAHTAQLAADADGNELLREGEARLAWLGSELPPRVDRAAPADGEREMGGGRDRADAHTAERRDRCRHDDASAGPLERAVAKEAGSRRKAGDRFDPAREQLLLRVDEERVPGSGRDGRALDASSPLGSEQRCQGALSGPRLGRGGEAGGGEA
mmetsp:Transcript_1142/g.3778  ORF Transcript_1142/g.3778 Transcript_1142/m.3778 type:complete len:161 (-) Transcript_1142:233-715(-)|eukprot:scaffold90721_cov30-Tisochrysis_lutea.AAC.4